MRENRRDRIMHELCCPSDLQGLLSHKGAETTRQHYAEFDGLPALQRWQKFRADQKSLRSREPENGGQ